MTTFLRSAAARAQPRHWAFDRTVSRNVLLKLGTGMLAVLMALPPRSGTSFPLSGDDSLLPPGTELNEEALVRPREVSRSEAIGGHKSYLVNLGELAFNSSAILGG